MPSSSCSRWRSAARRALCSHQSRHASSESPETVFDAGVEQPGGAQLQHDLGHAAGEKYLHGGEAPRAVGQRVHEARNLAIDLNPIGDRGTRQACGVRDGGKMDEQIRRSAKGGVQHHGIADGRGSENVARAQAKLMQAQKGAGRAARGVEPDGLAGGRKRGVRQREAERLADDLRRGRGAQELAASAGRRAGAAAHFGGIFERDLVLRKARADGLHFARVLAGLRAAA